MLKPKKKLSKKELKEDPILTSIGQAKTFYESYRKYISYAVTALIVVVVGVVIFMNNRRANDEKAATELGKVYRIYDAGASDKTQYAVAINGQPERGIMGLKKIVDEYGGSHSGELARFYLANAYFNSGQYDEALKNFESFSSDDRSLRASAMAGSAACYEAKHDMAKAAGKYEQAASVAGTDGALTPEYINNAGRAYGLAGEKEKAVEIFKRLKKDYPTSTFARDADRYITEFSL